MGNTSRATSVVALTAALLVASCASTTDVQLAAIEQPTVTSRTAEAAVEADPATGAAPTTAPPTTGVATTPESAPAADDGLLAGGVDPATLETTPEGDVLVQPTPIALQNRQLPSSPRLDPPLSDAFEFTIEPLEGEPSQQSTWNELCPVPTSNLRYVTVSFWGFDGIHHNGELIVAANEAENIVGVFRRLHAIRFPIEEMRIVTPLDVVARRTGDGNNTASYVCRQITGGTSFSEHAFGLAIDINPFQNPYQFDEVVIPSLASAYLDRDNLRPGMIVRGDPAGDEVIAAFADIGWRWGGDWFTLKDYQHFTRNNR